jgi:GGDEF domain-containing protein
MLDGQELLVGVSIGVAWSHVGQSTTDLLRHADMAMYSVKHGGKGQYAVFEGHALLQPTHEAALELWSAH